MMAIIRVDEMWSRQESSASYTDKFKKLQMEFKTCYQVQHTPDTTMLQVYYAPGLPARGSYYPGTTFVFAEKAQPKRVSPIMSLIDITWSGEVGGDPSDSPLNAKPTIEWDDVGTEEEIDQDYDGNPIVTVNNEPITGVKVEIPDQVVNIQRNMLNFSTYAQAVYRRATNSDTFLGWPPGTARVTKLRAKSVYDKDLGYWDVSASIRFRYPYRTTADKAWYARVRHEGFYVKEGSRIIRAFDQNGEPMTKKVLLKQDGTRETNPNNAVWLEFKRFGSLPFNALGLI